MHVDKSVSKIVVINVHNSTVKDNFTHQLYYFIFVFLIKLPIARVDARRYGARLTVKLCVDNDIKVRVQLDSPSKLEINRPIR